MYLRLNDMFSLMFVLKAFNKIVIKFRKIWKHLTLSNAIISWDFVHEIYSRYIEQIFLMNLLF